MTWLMKWLGICLSVLGGLLVVLIWPGSLPRLAIYQFAVFLFTFWICYRAWALVGRLPTLRDLLGL